MIMMLFGFQSMINYKYHEIKIAYVVNYVILMLNPWIYKLIVVDMVFIYVYYYVK